jgi:hypothetical protein
LDPPHLIQGCERVAAAPAALFPAVTTDETLIRKGEPQ